VTNQGDRYGGNKRILVVAAIAVAGVMVFGVPALAGTMLFAIPLTGEAEVPGPGDRDGTGTADLNLIPKRERVCFKLTVQNIEMATMAHIHKAPAGQKGDIVRGLAAPSDGDSKGCVRLGRKKIMQIKNNPSGYYVNVHNNEFPDGALRGQLHN
jgi:hypothetical protein